jgi:hypothetical protein
MAVNEALLQHEILKKSREKGNKQRCATDRCDRDGRRRLSAKLVKALCGERHVTSGRRENHVLLVCSSSRHDHVDQKTHLHS